MAKPQSKKIRNSAKGESCQLQIYPYCDCNPDQTVFCHMPSPDNGVGLKASQDFWGAYGGATCHDIVDGKRKTDLSEAEILRCMMRGIYRTQKILISKGLLNYG